MIEQKSNKYPTDFILFWWEKNALYQSITLLEQKPFKQGFYAKFHFNKMLTHT